MTVGIRVAVRAMLVMFLISMAAPITSLAQSATPVTVPETPVPTATADPETLKPHPSITTETPGSTPENSQSSPDQPRKTPALHRSPQLEASSLTITQVTVDKMYCQDDTRAGSTDFVLQSESAPMLRSAGATCTVAPIPDPAEFPVTVTLTNEGDSSIQYSVTLDGAYQNRYFNKYIYDVPEGTYTISQTGAGNSGATSQPTELSGHSVMIKIIDYVPVTDLPEPEDDDWENHSVSGKIQFCTSPDRNEGDVEFQIDNSSLFTFLAQDQAASIDCVDQPADYSLDGQLAAHSYDPDTGVIDTYGEEAYASGYAGFSIAALQAGSYVLGWTDPLTGVTTYSQPFLTQPNGPGYSLTTVDVLVFSEPVITSVVNLRVEYCVAPDRVGDTTFIVSGPSMLAASSALMCRGQSYGTGADPDLEFTLTNIDSNRIWTETVAGWTDSWQFTGIPAGAYTMSRIDGGATSAKFQISEGDDISVTARLYIPEADWNWPDPANPLQLLQIRAHICLNPGMESSGAFVFTYAPSQDGSGSDSTPDSLRCRPATEADGLELILTHADTTISLNYAGSDYAPGEFEAWTPSLSGEFVLTETSSGVSSGPMSMGGFTEGDFYLYQNAAVTLDISSSAPEIATTLPDGGVWTVTQGEMTIASGELATSTTLPVTAISTGGLALGDYTVSFDAGPAFEPYSRQITIDQATQGIQIVLDPVAESEVKITVTSSDPAVDATLPANATWTVTKEGSVLASDTFAGDDLALPATIGIEDAVPFGTYFISINGGPEFQRYEAYVTIQELTQTVEIELDTISHGLSVYKDICVDPNRVDDVFFHFNLGVTDPHVLRTASNPDRADCRFAKANDGDFSFTLTNTDTSRTWTESASDGAPARFQSLPSGTYTLTESHDGQELTSDPFVYDRFSTAPTVYSRSFIAEMDWDPAEEQIPYIEIDITAYQCDSDDNNVIGEFFHYGPDASIDPTDGTGSAPQGLTEAHCTLATTSDGFAFEAIPEDPGLEPISFQFFGNGLFVSQQPNLAPGRYEIVETRTGVSTGMIDISGVHFLDFMRYEDAPESAVALNVTSADPTIADRMPDGATWSVTRIEDPAITTDGTFASNVLQLPASIAVHAPISFGTYTIAVDAGPAFEPYEDTVTINRISQTIDVELIPAEPIPGPETVSVELQVDSADHATANRLPEGSTWVLTSDESPELVFTGTFDPGNLALPAAVILPHRIPVGRYTLEIDATPDFEPYREQVTLGDDGIVPLSIEGFFVRQEAPVVIGVLLQPVENEPSPTKPATETPEPTETATPAPTGTATPAPTNESETRGTPAVSPSSTGTPESITPASPVTSLPTTGQGTTRGNTGTLLLIVATSATLALVCGAAMRWTRDRSRA